jgi:hypothetical protein
VSIGKHDGIGWGGHRQHEGKGCTQGTGDHDIQWIEADGTRLERNTALQLTAQNIKAPLKDRVSSNLPASSAGPSDTSLANI